MKTPVVRLVYETGFPTALHHRPLLAEYLRALGPPVRIVQTAFTFHLEWSPIYPDAGPAPEYGLSNPWRGDKRKLVSVELE